MLIFMGKDSATIKLQGISSGQRMTISALAMCGSTGTIVLRDDTTVYAEMKKVDQGVSPQLLGHITAKYTGGSNLRLEVSVSHVSIAMDIKSIINYANIVEPSGVIKGNVCNVAIEESTDGDYNDYLITIVSTDKVN